MADSEPAKPASKRYMGISRIYAVIASVMFAVAAWSATRIVAGERSVVTSISIDLALGFVMAALSIYFYVLAKRADVAERASSRGAER